MEDTAETLTPLPPRRLRRSLKSETHRVLIRILSHFKDVSQIADQNLPQQFNQELDENDCTENRRELVVAEERCGGDGLQERNEAIEDCVIDFGDVDISEFEIDFGGLGDGSGETLMDELERFVEMSDDIAIEGEEARNNGTAGPVVEDQAVINEALDEERIIEQKAMDEMEVKEDKVDLVCGRSDVNSPNHTNDVDMEEGEISDDNRSMGVISHDTVRSEESKDVDDPRKHSGTESPCKEFDSDSFLRSISDNFQNSEGHELRECRAKTIGTLGVVAERTMEGLKEGGSDNLVRIRGIEEKDSGIARGTGFLEACSNSHASHEKTSENYETKNCGAAYEDEGDAGAPKKRKRLSKEQKQRKKAKERLKRAEMNRKQGVNRLKLHYVEKPKVVVYCRHYIAGRCHEGENCKFSHDTVPLTKSKPCKHFARRSCLKGDDCPYDHQLSKYPCDNFVKNGSCIRGDRCLFSHEIPSLEEGTSKPGFVPPSVQGSSSSSQVNIGSPSVKTSHALPHSTGTHSHHNTELIMARTLLEQPTMSTEGFSFLSTRKPSLLHSSMSKQGVSTPDRNSGAKAGNLMQQIPSSSVPNTKESTLTTPSVVTPKGINFLSFGKASPDGSSGKKQSHPQPGQTVSSTVQNFDAAPKLMNPAQPLASNFLSVGKRLADSSGGNPFSLPSTSNNGHNSHFGEGQSVYDKSHFSSPISSRSRPSPLTTGRYSDYTASRFNDAVNQRALSSRLAFAEKCDSKKMNQSVGLTSTQVDQEAKRNDSGKAFNVFDFLSSIGSTTKQ